MSTNTRIRIGLVTVTLLGLALTGCSKEDPKRSNPPPINTEAQIKEIQDNTHMPQQAKDSAIATIRQQLAAAAAKAKK